MAAKGKTLLKVTGILLLVVASLSLLLALLAFASGGSAFAAGGYDDDIKAELLKRAMDYILLGGAAFLGGAVNLTTGIFGLRYAARPEKANRCLVMGVIAVSLDVLLFFWGLLRFRGFGGPLGNLLLLPLLICYLVGAVMNRQDTPAKAN